LKKIREQIRQRVAILVKDLIGKEVKTWNV
jgi:hypothetical protein